MRKNKKNEEAFFSQKKAGLILFPKTTSHSTFTEDTVTRLSFSPSCTDGNQKKITLQTDSAQKSNYVVFPLPCVPINFDGRRLKKIRPNNFRPPASLSKVRIMAHVLEQQYCYTQMQQNYMLIMPILLQLSGNFTMWKFRWFLHFPPPDFPKK